MGRFGTAALRPIYELVAKGGCKLGRSGLFGAIPNLLRRHWGGKLVHGRCSGCHNALAATTNAILFVDNEAACAALTTGTAKNPGSSTRYRTLDGESTDRGKPRGPPLQRPRAVIRNRACQRARLSIGHPTHVRFFVGDASACKVAFLRARGNLTLSFPTSEPRRICDPSLTKSPSPVLRAAVASA